MAALGKKAFGFRATDRRWESPLGRFVNFYGADELASRMEVHKTAVYHWVSGAAAPRPEKAFAIRRIARSTGFAISLDDIYQHFLEDGAETRRSFRQSQPARVSLRSDQKQSTPNREEKHGAT
jgi:DNA-binding transcriptional regulator YdaS (Cro superfamily)